MSEKRFSWKTEKLQHSDDEVLLVVDNENKDWKGHILNIVELLNKLYEENEQLKFENETLKSNYQREIQSSIDFCNAYSKTNGELLEEIEKLEEENEQLKSRIAFFEEQEDEFEKYTAQTIQNMIADYRDD